MPKISSKSTNCSYTICVMIFGRIVMERSKILSKRSIEIDKLTSLINYRHVSKLIYLPFNKQIEAITSAYLTKLSPTNICISNFELF